MDRSVLTILVQLTVTSHIPYQLSFSHLPAELLPMLSVAATFLGYTANNPNKKEKRKQVRRGKDKSKSTFIYLSAEDPVFETACKMDTNMTHVFWIK